MRTCALFLFLACAAAQELGPEQLFKEAMAAQQRGDDTAAIRDYRQLLKQQPDMFQARANLGVLLARQGHFDEAIEQYRLALDGHESDSRFGFKLRFNLAIAYYKKSAFEEAAREFDTLHRANLADTRVSTLLGDCYAHLGQDEQALAILGPIEAANPDDLAVASLLAPVLIRTGHQSEGMARYDKVGRLGHSAEAYLLAGQTALKLSLFEDARDYADAAIKLDPHFPGVYTLRGMALPLLGDSEGAIEALNKALAADPNDFDAHFTLGKTLRTAGDLPGARRHLARAMQLKPDSAVAFYEMARVERGENKIEDAVKDFEHAIHLDPKWAQPHVELSALYFRLNRPADGEREKAEFDRLNVLPGGKLQN
ncbi:MAG TPA: tetratricopeptide repeat protein [Bryobacteraceae bacterium]